MKNRKLFFVAICLVLSILLCACTDQPKQPQTQNGGEISFDDANPSYDEKNATKIEFSGGSASVKGVGASASGADVRIGASGTYILSGSTTNGSITIDASKLEIKLVLKGVSISNSDGPAVLVKNAKKVIFTIVEGTENLLSDGSSYEIKEVNSIVDGAIFAKSDLVFNGAGKLTVKGNNAHGIVGKDGLTISGGNINVSSKNAAICGKDYIKIANANLTINAGTDGLKSDNISEANKGYITIQSGTFDITAGNDAIQSFGVTKIESGSFNIKTTLTDPLASAKGIKGTNGIEILGGTFVIDTVDDSIHSDVNVLISGGDFAISSGDDGIHANEELAISGGNISVNNSYEGLEATTVKISGGNVKINASDDGINSAGGNDQSAGGDSFSESNGGIYISGGYTTVVSGADGIDVVGAFNMSGGVLLIDGPSSAKSGALDFGTTSRITGGIIVALGFSNNPETFVEASQGIAMIENDGDYSSGDVISICDKDGKVILAFTSARDFNGMLISAPAFRPGNTFEIYKNATVFGLDENGFASDTTQNGGEVVDSLIFE